jgi:NADPH2:quinone reductase
LTPREREAAVGAITRMLADKQLIHNLATTYPLDQIVAAHEAVEQGKSLGNVVVKVG